jgi:hypothetical protein
MPQNATARPRLVLLFLTILLSLALGFTVLQADEPDTPVGNTLPPPAPTSNISGLINFHPLVHNAPTPVP